LKSDYDLLRKDTVGRGHFMGPGQDKAPIGKQALYGSRAKGRERKIKAPRVSGDRKPKKYRKICRRKVKKAPGITGKTGGKRAK